MLVCCVIFLLILIILYHINVTKKATFYPQRINVCENAIPKESCSELTQKSTISDCLDHDMDHVVNPLTMIYSNRPERFLFANKEFALWPGQHYYEELDDDTPTPYYSSCVNVGLKCKECPIDKTEYRGTEKNKLKMNNCFSAAITGDMPTSANEVSSSTNVDGRYSRENFLSDRDSAFDKRFFKGQGAIEDDIKFPVPVEGAPSIWSQYAPMNSAGGVSEPGFTPSEFYPDGNYYSEYVELQNRLDDYKKDHGY